MYSKSYDKLFKNCNILYVKDHRKFIEFVGYLRGKIVISDSKELGNICNVHGIIHILNPNASSIPNEKIDCIIMDKIDKNVESKVIYSDIKPSVVYLGEGDDDMSIKKWCGICHSTQTINTGNPINKYCSDKCMQLHNGFAKNFRPDTTKDLDFNNIMAKHREKNIVIEFEKNTSETKNVTDKFQKSMEKDAIRLEFAFKRETYRKEMRQPSLRKASVSDKKKKVSGPVHTDHPHEQVSICKGVTKKGDQCTNRSIGSSNFCGIMSHSTGYTG